MAQLLPHATKRGILRPVAGKTSFEGFRPTRAGRRRAHRVAVVAFDGVVLGDMALPCEVFALATGANGQPLYDVRVCSVAPAVTSAHVTLQVPWRLSAVDRADTIIVPGLTDIGQPIHPSLLHAMRRGVDRGARVASICTGAFILARTQRLDGLTATTHWAAAAELARRH